MAGQGLADRARDYQPTKTVLFWSCAACVAATLVVGFNWGGWVTGKTAGAMARAASEQGRAQLAATVCVEQFMAAPGAQAKLVSLKAEESWKRRTFVAEGGWATLPGMKEPVSDAAEVCAERLGAMEAPPRKAVQG